MFGKGERSTPKGEQETLLGVSCSDCLKNYLISEINTIMDKTKNTDIPSLLLNSILSIPPIKGATNKVAEIIKNVGLRGSTTNVWGFSADIAKTKNNTDAPQNQGVILPFMTDLLFFVFVLCSG